MMADSTGQAFTTLLTDRAFRSQRPKDLATTLRHLSGTLGVPAYLNPLDRCLLRTAASLGAVLPGPVRAGVTHKIRQQSAQVLLEAQDPQLSRFLSRARAEGLRVNINYLGEEVLSETQAQERLQQYHTLIERPDVEAISIKLSSIVSKLDILAFEYTLDTLLDRLTPLFERALQQRFYRPNGEAVPKLINLDMEAFDDLPLTVALFKALLDQPSLRSLQAGLVLQAYLPAAAQAQKDLVAFAQERLTKGGAPLRLRLVKGANLAQEQTLCSMRNWPLPIYDSKADVDANYKRMLEYGCQPANAVAVHLGVASHNVFDLALALVLRARHGTTAQVGLEMLHGMADPLRRAVQTLCDDVLIYAPLVERDNFEQAIAYLVRRLDENTAPENFLRHSFAMSVGDATYEDQQQRFVNSFNRRQHVEAEEPGTRPTGFRNEPDTRWSLPEARTAALQALQNRLALPPPHLPLFVGDQPCSGESTPGFDPSRPDVVPYHITLANSAQLQTQLQVATRAQADLANTTLEKRARLLHQVADALRGARFELLALMAIDGGKRLDEADPEISEAIDFAEYYRYNFQTLAARQDVVLYPRGTTVITPPWNFPLAIAAGGVLAALMAGNPVLLKPPLETFWVGYRFAELCWEAGVPRNWLQVCACTDEVGSALIRSPQVAQVVLTGATSTARLFQRLRPGLRLLAETGGKNAIIATAHCDRDQLIADVLHSAFGHSGQKCSAASLLICTPDLYDDHSFLAALGEAVASLPVGSALDPKHIITPLIRPPSEALARGLQDLPSGSTWLLRPEIAKDNPRLVRPGVKVGVQAGTFDHQTEFFGPLLGVMRADNLTQALEFANGTPYGLTSGLHSLLETEQQYWLQHIQAGNLYINRGITGAIVSRQAFGGIKASSVGPGAKAGGPNYVAQLCHLHPNQPPTARPTLVPSTPIPAAVAALLTASVPQLSAQQAQVLSRAATEFAAIHEAEFATPQTPTSVLGELNQFAYVPLNGVVLRVEASAEPLEVLIATTAALTSNPQWVLSISPAFHARYPWLKTVTTVTNYSEDPSELCTRLDEIPRIRLLGEPPQVLVDETGQAGIHLETAPVLAVGRFELLNYVRERSLSHRYHRYGNLAGARLLPRLDTGH